MDAAEDIFDVIVFGEKGIKREAKGAFEIEVAWDQQLLFILRRPAAVAGITTTTPELSLFCYKHRLDGSEYEVVNDEEDVYPRDFVFLNKVGTRLLEIMTGERGKFFSQVFQRDPLSQDKDRCK